MHRRASSSDPASAGSRWRRRLAKAKEQQKRILAFVVRVFLCHWVMLPQPRGQCLVDALRSLGVEVEDVEAMGLWAQRDGNRLLAPLGLQLSHCEGITNHDMGQFIIHIPEHFMSLISCPDGIVLRDSTLAVALASVDQLSQSPQTKFFKLCCSHGCSVLPQLSAYPDDAFGSMERPAHACLIPSMAERQIGREILPAAALPRNAPRWINSGVAVVRWRSDTVDISQHLYLHAHAFHPGLPNTYLHIHMRALPCLSGGVCVIRVVHVCIP